MDADDERAAWRGRFLDDAAREPVPEKVRRLAGGARLSPVWRNALGGLTYRADGDDARFIKYGPRTAETSMADEAERMRWASAFVVVPRPLCAGEEGGHEWLVTAHVGLGALGVADRWADIAVAAMSTERNYGPGWEEPLLEAYGIDEDPERMAYYRELWNNT